MRRLTIALFIIGAALIIKLLVWTDQRIDTVVKPKPAEALTLPITGGLAEVKTKAEMSLLASREARFFVAEFSFVSFLWFDKPREFKSAVERIMQRTYLNDPAGKPVVLERRDLIIEGHPAIIFTIETNFLAKHQTKVFFIDFEQDLSRTLILASEAQEDEIDIEASMPNIIHQLSNS